LKNEVGDDARICAGEKESVRRLPLGEQMEVLAPLRKDIPMKAFIPFN
jgi:hypothetical protein